MAKVEDLNKGDRVRWGTSQGKTTGKVVGIKTKPFSIKGTDLKASKDSPKVLVESEKTGAQAGHKPSALKKLAEEKAKGKADEKASTTKSKATKAAPKKAAAKKVAAKKKAAPSKAKATTAKKTTAKKKS